MPHKTKTILVDVIHPRLNGAQSLARLQELEELVTTYGHIVVVKTYQRRFAPHPRTYIGPGKAAELAQEARELGAKLVVINDDLKAKQIYLLQDLFKKEAGADVWDRLDLILKIFQKHASTTEARLEIELASIRHMGPRIFGMGMELSRQGGGIGTVGIGETNIEIMRRHLKERTRQILKDLATCEQVRKTHREARAKRGLKTVALVGYTNAGKTTLLNTLTGRHEYAANKLFATLDTRVGSLHLPRTGRELLVSDTIGFIRDLPPTLLHAFHATLSEATEAQALLLTLDIADPLWKAKLSVVDEVLQDLGAEHHPTTVVCNKSDAVTDARRIAVRRHLKDRTHVFVSAKTGLGLPKLIEQIEYVCYPDSV